MDLNASPLSAIRTGYLMDTKGLVVTVGDRKVYQIWRLVTVPSSWLRSYERNHIADGSTPSSSVVSWSLSCVFPFRK